MPLGLLVVPVKQCVVCAVLPGAAGRRASSLGLLLHVGPIPS